MAITETNLYTYGHGELWIGDHVAGGMPSKMNTPVVQIDALEITETVERIEHISKRTSIAKKDLKIVRQVAASGKLTCSGTNINLLKLYLYASETAIAGGSVAATAFAQALAAVGDYLPLPGGKSKVSALAVTDSNGTPATLALGTDYEADVDAGIVKILNLGAYTQPFKAAFTEAAGSQLNLMASQPGAKGLRFKEINLANSNAVRIVNLPKIDFDPVSSWPLMGDGNEVNKFELSFEVLEDTSNAVYPFGNYRI
ncbi:MAG: hypothetical protein ABI539_15690 [Acidobacteriota bacterium]